MKKYFILLFCLILVWILRATTIIIDIEGNGDYTSIQTGINNSVSGDTVLVYPGIYQENINYEGRDIAVISLFYATGDSSYIFNTVIGDVEDGCIVTFENYETIEAVLGGLSIREGTGSTFPNYRSGGISCLNFSSPTLKNLNIYGNNYGAAGGIYCEYSDPLIENCHIHDNEGHRPIYGGGITLYHSNAQISNCLIENNGVYVSGGGICVFELCDPLIENTIIKGNHADCGGGIFAQACNLTLQNVLLESNYSGYGGGINLYYYVNPDFENVTIINNTSNQGAGVFLNTLDCEITGLEIIGSSSYDYAGMVIFNSNITFNKLLICNSTIEYTGALASNILLNYGSIVTIENSTFSGNISEKGTFLLMGSSVLNINNSIVADAGDSFHFVHNEMGNNNNLIINYCDILNGETSLDCDEYGSYLWGESNISEDPCFACPDEKDWRLMYYSPCIDAGDPESDYDPDGTICDMGALYYDQDELVYPEINIPDYLHFESGEIVEMDFTQYIYDINPDELTLSVNGNENVLVDINDMQVTFSCLDNWSGVELLTFYVNDNSGRLISSAEMTVDVTNNIIFVPEDHENIQDAIQQACLDSTMIIVGPGEYHENLDFLGKNINLVSHYETTGDSIYISDTIIDGDSLASVITIHNCEEARVNGFTIKNGNGDYVPYIYHGGGIDIDSCLYVRISNVILKENYGSTSGIMSINSRLDFLDSKLRSNNNNLMYIEETGEAEISNLEIYENDDSNGSTIRGNTDYQMNINNIRYHNNYYSYNGTGLSIITYCESTIDNINIENNELGISNALYLRCSDNVSISNIGVKNNHSDYFSSSISLNYSSDVLLDRVIIEGNINDNGGPILDLYNTENIIITNALIKDNISNGNFSLIYISDSNTCIINSTIINNTNNNGAIITSLFNSMLEPYLINTILYDNEIAQIQLGNPSIRSRILHVNHCDVEGGEEGVLQYEGALLYWEEGNIDADPEFLGIDPYPNMLMSSSPCIDAGTLDFPVYFEMPETDLAGNPRISGDSIDMGCYEYQFSDNEDAVIQSSLLKIQNYPNPFNPETTISFSSTKDTKNTEISIYNIKGQRLRELKIENVKCKMNTVVWDGKDDSGNPVGSGVYFYQLKAGDMFETRKMILLK